MPQWDGMPYTGKHLISLMITMCIVLSGCTTMKISEYQSSDYKKENIENSISTVQHKGLVLSLRHIRDKNERVKYFGLNSKYSNILIFFIEARNTSNTDSYLISKEQFSLLGVTSEASSNQFPDGKTGSDMAQTALGGAIFVPIAIAAVAPIAIIAGTKSASDASIIEHNFSVKELKRHTVSPGETIQGFIYYNLPKDNKSYPEKGALQFQVQQLRVQETNNINLEFSF